jgi:hypothetical protein
MAVNPADTITRIDSADWSPFIYCTGFSIPLKAIKVFGGEEYKGAG